MGRPRRRVRRSGQRRRRRHRRSATSGRAPSCCATTAATGNNWLQIRTVGTRSNRDGIGCRVKVVSASGLTQYFTVTTAVGYLSASDKRLIVGLGRDTVATLVEIRWPSGVVQTFENVKAGQTLDRDRAGAMMTRRALLALLALLRRDPCSGRASPRAVSGRSRAASHPGVRSSRASPTSRSRPGSRSRSSTAASDSKSYIIEVVGCGVAFFDYDNDGWLDLLRAERHAARRRARRAPPTGCTRTTATARSPTSPRRPA